MEIRSDDFFFLLPLHCFSSSTPLLRHRSSKVYHRLSLLFSISSRTQVSIDTSSKQTSLLISLILGNYAMTLSALVVLKSNPLPDNLLATFSNLGKEIVPLPAMQFPLDIRCLFSASESAKDLLHVTKDFTANFTTPKEDTEIYRDPTDPC